MLLQVLVQLTAVVTLMLAVSTVVLIGRYRLRDTRLEWRDRVRATAPITIVLALVLLFNGVARDWVPDVSLMIGWHVTELIYDVEQYVILWLQSQATPELTAYFSFIYIYGYVFLLVFPLVAYFALSNTRPLRELLTAYTLNYVLGLCCYALVVAYGPRNIMPDLVQPLLYDTYPQYQHLTRQVNRNTNVFPSLHTSLSATVAFLAYRTRRIYPTWAVLATIFALSIGISTMYLGIHWVIDVLAGVGLAAVSVALSGHLVGRFSISAWLENHVPSSDRIGTTDRPRDAPERTTESTVSSEDE
ncbi:phosphatase PAP2 family protein [Natronobacterium gregoryi]|uniref:Inositol phosphorylceramide synthase n=2 Tax=Natronobacterium gregoryi TaxID=44930 RepID=L0ADD6_NATGS|nr:phosphatase PAP2 family protein [Natronobacterium gregoryi]AFZ71866.1 membrane-associated phospholipid phosphatase [Natronobacterium gregoryi SP2]ELY73064.1 PA-phosphatase-like phosphoesterase [Natronobacterium gregoryi SP2]PLK19382.1 inositol phosphorylceramide synthase [Natronobacterium gregoryi SP2]SFJ50703.1 Membrane-associated phospholipid phosphatase [Natronobacterium gregoryi]